jgi:hypothetical protein
LSKATYEILLLLFLVANKLLKGEASPSTVDSAQSWMFQDECRCGGVKECPVEVRWVLYAGQRHVFSWEHRLW